MNVKFTGKIIAAGQVQMGTSQNGTQWSSCEYTIEELNEQYPSRAVISVYGSDKLQQFNIQLGEIITAHIGLKARQSKEGRWFNQLDCWKNDQMVSSKVRLSRVRLAQHLSQLVGITNHSSSQYRSASNLSSFPLRLTQAVNLFSRTLNMQVVSSKDFPSLPQINNI